MNKKIIVSTSLIPSSSNSPLDARARINTISEVESIQVPFVGMIFYVIDEEKFYVVKTLKSSMVGNIELKDTLIDVFEPLVNIDASNIDLESVATKEFVEEQIAAVELMPGPEGPAGKDFTYDMFTEEQLEALKGADGAEGPQGPKGDAFKYEDFTETQLELLRGPQGIDGAPGVQGERGEDGYTPIKGVDYFTDEDINAIKYDDSEVKERIDTLEKINLETKPYIDANGMLVLCGHPAIARRVGNEVHVTIRFFNNEEDKFIFTPDDFAKTRICMGYGAEGIGTKRNIVETTLELYDLDRVFIIDGGSQITGEVGTVNIIAERVNYIDGIQGARAMNGGEKNIVHNFNVKVKDVKLIDTLYGGGNGYSVVWNSNIEIDGETEINYLTAGGSNGFTRKGHVVINDGHIKVAQGVNRGIVETAEFIINGGQIDNFYIAGEVDPSVTGILKEGYVEFNDGKVENLFEGNGFNKVSGYKINTEIVNDDQALLNNFERVQINQEEEVDLSEYAKIEFVEEQIANIELKEGPAGKDFTYDMFTEEQLEALRGPEGPAGADGQNGQDGVTPVKGVDYFTAEDIAALNIPSIEGLATETYVQNKIAEAQLNNDGEVNLEGLATKDDLNLKADKTELVGLASETFVAEQIAAIEHPQYDDSEVKERIEILEAIDHEEFLKEHQDISHLATKEEVEKLHQRKYEVSGLPEGTLVNYSEKEIRVMCPEGTEFHTQQVGVGGLSNRYYMTMTMFAPEGAVTFREGAQGVLEDEIRTVSNGKRSRWFSLAILNEETGEWAYRGAESTAENCIGWTNIVEWYDAEDKVISRETIRINLANEECFDKVAPLYNEPVATKEFVEEQIAAIELLEGPEGPAGAAFTYDMFTEEQLEALRGPAGADGADGQNGADGKDFTYDMFTEEQLEALRGPAGQDGQNGQDGADGVDGKDFTYDMFTPEQLEALRGPAGQDGADGQNGADGAAFTYDMFTEEQLEALRGPAGQDGKDGQDGAAGQDGAQGVSVVSMVIDENNHLMVTLSNDQVLDAGEVPVGSGGEGGGADEEEVAAIKTELAETKQELLDLTYGVEYEWIYFYDQPTSATMALGFGRETAPKFYEDVDAAMAAGDAEYESFLYSIYEQDIYRMYVLKTVADHKVFNRYELLPVEDSTAQPANTYLPTWNPVKGLTGWNVDTEVDTKGFTLCGSSAPTSAMSFAFMKVKEEYRGKF